ncbi:hypothetical protein C2L65_44995 [Paraburkholderia terrae]|uniref:Uncharacterized protein n=1 Tax=Paraburkholderia terrae TaxID=311230 RepID=A0A2I8F4T5_9BURK|nr:hypothetical protein C2L65_44995 [Paraburkholderia terrae]
MVGSWHARGDHLLSDSVRFHSCETVIAKIPQHGVALWRITGITAGIEVAVDQVWHKEVLLAQHSRDNEVITTSFKIIA